LTVHPLLLRWHHGLLCLLFGVVGILALVVLGSHHRLPLLGDQWVMASCRHLKTLIRIELLNTLMILFLLTETLGT
jgi:hypothetical protein